MPSSPYRSAWLARPGALCESVLRRVRVRPPAARSTWSEYGRPLALFLVTALSIAANHHYFTGAGPGACLLASAAVLSILLAHEMGHYVACRIYGVDATLPHFIPAPLLNPLAGTMGAVIRIRAPFPHRRALFDVGLAGPLAGFAVCLPVLWLGLREATLVSADGDGLSLAEPLLFQWAAAWLLGELPAGTTLGLGPLGIAAWFGLLVTGLNLIPVGQLDGGHVSYALFRARATPLARGVWWLCLGLVFAAGPHWILWLILLRVLGLRHPPTLDDQQGLGAARQVLGVLAVAVFVVSFMPNPLMWSWDGLPAWAALLTAR